jgi:hypothetical protein
MGHLPGPPLNKINYLAWFLGALAMVTGDSPAAL